MAAASTAATEGTPRTTGSSGSSGGGGGGGIVIGGTTTDPSVVLASKRVVYVGGLADGATVDLVRAAFIPFGNIRSVDIPMDYVAGRHKGFAFVEYEDADDAAEAQFNMDGGELLGRTLKVNMAQPNQANKVSGSEAIWKSDEWFQKYAAGNDEEERAERRVTERDADVLKDL